MWLIGLGSVELSNLRTRDLSCCGMQAASLRVAEQYIQAFGNIAKEVNTTTYYTKFHLVISSYLLVNFVLPWVLLI